MKPPLNRPYRASLSQMLSGLFIMAAGKFSHSSWYVWMIFGVIGMMFMEVFAYELYRTDNQTSLTKEGDTQ